MKIRVAGLNIDINHLENDCFTKRYEEYFHDFEKADMKINFKISNENVLPDGEVIFENQYYSARKTALGKCETLISNNVPYISIYNNKDYSKFDIIMSSSIKSRYIEHGRMEYFHAGFCFAKRLSMFGGITFHSSSIALDNNIGICFSAPSGTGKSTHANLWEKHFGKRVKIINDDKPAVIFKNNIPYICGTPWSGKNEKNHNIEVPLKAIVFISQDENNKISRMSKTEAVIRLIEETINITTEREVADKLLEGVNKLSYSVPVFMLKCNTEKEAAEVCYNKIMEEINENKE